MFTVILVVCTFSYDVLNNTKAVRESSKTDRKVIVSRKGSHDTTAKSARTPRSRQRVWQGMSTSDTTVANSTLPATFREFWSRLNLTLILEANALISISCLRLSVAVEEGRAFTRESRPVVQEGVREFLHVPTAALSLNQNYFGIWVLVFLRSTSCNVMPFEIRFS